MNILDLNPISHVRRNHALEHATIKVLAERIPTLRMAGYSDVSGFWLLGAVQIEDVQAAVGEALARLEGGEHSLAIHPNCGTNFVAAGFLAGTLAWLGMLGSGRKLRDQLERLPLVMTLVTLGLMAAQPLGPFLQANVTTAAAPRGMQVVSISRQMRGDMPVHHVETRV